jgi:hypothetical protein
MPCLHTIQGNVGRAGAEALAGRSCNALSWREQGNGVVAGANAPVDFWPIQTTTTWRFGFCSLCSRFRCKVLTGRYLGVSMGNPPARERRLFLRCPESSRDRAMHEFKSIYRFSHWRHDAKTSSERE